MAGGLALPALAQPPAQEQARRIGKDTLECGEKIFGVDFSDAEEEQALAGVNRNLDAYEQLRAIDVPLDTEPAVTFRPYLPGKKPKPGATPGAKIKVTLQAPAARRSSLDDLAFLPVTALAPLVQRREVSSTDLTKMYLDRLKKFGPKLNCVVTLTEELALAQAAQADKEIRAGKYKGPLHGIPWGGKDLFATKGIPTTWGAGPFQNQVFDYDATIVERLRDAGAVLVAKLSMGALAQGDRWFRGQTRTPWNPENGVERIVGRAGLGDGRRASSASPSAPRRAARSSRRRRSTASRACGRPTAASAATARWRSAGRWTRSARCADRSRTARSSSTPSTAPTAATTPSSTRRSRWNPDVPLSKLRIGYIKTEFEAPPPTAERPRRGRRRWRGRQDVARGAAAAACHRKNSGGGPKSG